MRPIFGKTISHDPDRFIAKWQASDLTERAAAQSHFNDLCALLGEPTPADADPDAAVAAAYGWRADLFDDEILARLFALNQERAGAPAAA